MLPVVAIIGRPNVGKSTLFNRLTRTRDAVVSDVPGTTRDRQYGEVHLDGYHFILIDTGGIGETAETVDSLITKQALQAVSDADQTLLVLDGKTGITANDRMIAETLRRTGKPLIVVINKTENQSAELAVTEAYEFGFERAAAISSAHGRGIAELLAITFPTPPTDTSSYIINNKDEIKLAIVGQPNVGKSTLTNRMLGEERVIVHDTSGTTRDSIFVPLSRHDKHYVLIDTAGVRRRKNTTAGPEKFSVVKTLQSIENSHVVLFVINGRSGVTDQDLKLLGFVLECGKGLVLAVNKWDGMTEDAREHARNSLDRQLDFVQFARVFYISALHGSGVGNLFGAIDEAYVSATKKLSTSTLTRLLQEAQTTHTPPLVSGRRIKMRYAHAGGSNPPRIIIHGNQLQDLPMSYRRFLSSFFQRKLGLYGTPVRIEFKLNSNPYNPYDN